MTYDDLANATYLDGRCLIRPVQVAKTDSLIIMPEIHDSRQPIGQVVNCGVSKRGPLEIADGDWVIFERTSAAEFNTEDVGVLNVVRQEDILGTIEA
jgi:co-chaperonin GroES (HSP10)